MKTFNNTKLTEEEIMSRKRVGIIRNNWRQRMITLYESDDATKVYMIGIAFDNSMKVISHEDVGMNERHAMDYWNNGKKVLIRD